MIWRAQCLLWLEAGDEIFILPKNCASSFSPMQFSFKILNILVFSLCAVRRPDLLKGLLTNTAMKFDRPGEKSSDKDCVVSVVLKSSAKVIFRVKWWSLDSEDDFRSGRWNISHYQQSFPGHLSHGQSNSIKVNNYWVQTIFYFADSCTVRWTYGWIIDRKMYTMLAYWELELISYLGSMG